MKKSLKRQDYHDYVWKRGERARTLFLCIGVTGVLSYFFYRSFLALLPLSVIGAAAFFLIRRQKLEKAKEALAGQFRECILAVATSLQAGYSVENAFLECR